MITWDNFNLFGICTLLTWICAFILLFFKDKTKTAITISFVGLLVLGGFIILLWKSLDRPPMRTMGETRLLYSFFIVSVGFIIYSIWKYKWLLNYSLFVASIFLIINLLKPEIHSKNLMPALQSVWFVPHVTAYILSYAILGAATIMGLKLLVSKEKKIDTKVLDLCDNLVYIGFGLLMLAMLMGAVWAKAAWGHYWSWDPKETWAFITAGAYLLYIHLRLNNLHQTKSIWILIIAFICLMITWKGVNYLPSAKNSVHVYSQT